MWDFLLKVKNPLAYIQVNPIISTVQSPMYWSVYSVGAHSDASISGLYTLWAAVMYAITYTVPNTSSGYSKWNDISQGHLVVQSAYYWFSYQWVKTIPFYWRPFETPCGPFVFQVKLIMPRLMQVNFVQIIFTTSFLTCVKQTLMFNILAPGNRWGIYGSTNTCNPYCSFLLTV